MTKARWFVVIVDTEGHCTAEPCESYDEAFAKGWAVFSKQGGIEGFHVTLSAGYWK